MRQFGVDPDAVMTPARHILTSGSPTNDSSTSSTDGESIASGGGRNERIATIRTTLKRRIQIKRTIAQVHEQVANPASMKRDMDYATCSQVKMRLVHTGCGYHIV